MDKNRSKANKIILMEERGSMAEKRKICQVWKGGCLQDSPGKWLPRWRPADDRDWRRSWDSSICEERGDAWMKTPLHPSRGGAERPVVLGKREEVSQWDPCTQGAYLLIRGASLDMRNYWALSEHALVHSHDILWDELSITQFRFGNWSSKG